jgi:hypothetical protein
MAHRTFEWDPIKAAANIQTQEEWRAIMVGHSGQDRLLVVSFVYRSDRIRIISARAATRGERREYEESA